MITCSVSVYKKWQKKRTHNKVKFSNSGPLGTYILVAGKVYVKDGERILLIYSPPLTPHPPTPPKKYSELTDRRSIVQIIFQEHNPQVG